MFSSIIFKKLNETVPLFLNFIKIQLFIISGLYTKKIISKFNKLKLKDFDSSLLFTVSITMKFYE